MDRLRAGLTGLGAVFLLTVGGSLVYGYHSDNQAISTPRKDAGEPLAQLGVAPGSEKSAENLPSPLHEPSARSPFDPAPFGEFATPDGSRDFGTIPYNENPVRSTPHPGEPAPAATV